jgi:hypothetical protein
LESRGKEKWCHDLYSVSILKNFHQTFLMHMFFM